ncbi:MAG: hypothetical protein Q4B65_00310 [Candidatus Saccharibacteria bacterium]|nr:hypothetical protein [Candidatus Saccharibacteria bacterium]
MHKPKQKGRIIIPAGRRPWPHELRTAQILAAAGHSVEFLSETNNLPTADIKLDGVEYEIKSPEKMNANSLEHLLKDALRQSPNIIINASRMRKIRDDSLCKFLMRQASSRKQIKNLLLITKQGRIIDIFALL